MTHPFFLGIEIGGTKLQLGIGHGDGQLLALERLSVVPEQGAQGVREQIVGAVDPLLRKAGVTSGASTIAAVGVGFGGPVDAQTGVVTTSYQVDGWDRFPLADWLRLTLGVNAVEVQNDADTAGLAEALFGAGRGVSPILYVTVGSGIGGGLILNRKIYRGAGAGAIELGHVWVIDRTDSDLGVVTLEKAASGWAIAGAARAYAERLVEEGRGQQWPVLDLAKGEPAAITTRHVAEAARQGDREALLLLENAVHAMTLGLSQAVTLLAPRRIVLGGGVSLIGEDLWIAPIRRQLETCVFTPFRGTFDVVSAELGEEVVVHGALALARDLQESSALII
ncbi:MAG: ROK family protein [Isosphaeraceae bacterium]